MAKSKQDPATPRANADLVNRAMKDVEAFLRSLDSLNDPTPSGAQVAFTNAGHHLRLHGRAAIRHRQLIDILDDATNRKRSIISRMRLTSLLNRACADCFDWSQPNEVLDPQLIDGALSKLRSELLSEALQFDALCAVKGFANNGQDFSLAGVRFAIAEAHGIQLSSAVDPRNELRGQFCASVSVQAQDKHAARDEAMGQIRGAVDVLNFLCECAGENALIWLPGQAGPADVFVLIANRATGTRTPNLRGLRSDRQLIWADLCLKLPWRVHMARALQAVDGSLKSSDSLDGLLTRAMQWAGRAASAASADVRFINYAIAIECLVGANVTSEITYRLSNRLAYLLGRTPAQRRELADDFRKLYDHRSSMVHSGIDTVSIASQRRMQNLALSAIVAMLARPGLNGSMTEQAIAKWLDDLTLGDNDLQL